MMTRDNQPFFSSRWVVSLFELIPIALFWTLHLWTNSRAMQGRYVFEATVVPLLGSAASAGFELSIVHVPLFLQLTRDALKVRATEAAAGSATALRMRRLVAAAAIPFTFYVIYSSRLRVWAGRIDAYDLHPELCAELSGTTTQGVPLIAVMYLMCLALLSVRLTSSIRGALATGLPTATSTNERVRWVSAGIGAIAFGASANGVLYFATGTGLI